MKFKILIVFFVLSMVAPCFGKEGEVYNKSCNKKEKYCSFSFIANEEFKSTGVFEVRVTEKTTRDDRTNHLYFIDCKKRVATSNEYLTDPINISDLAYGGEFKEWVVDIRKAWKSVCKK